MKTKNSSFGKAFLSKKRFAMVEIAIVLCSVFLVAIPAIAAQEQNQEMQKVSASGVTTSSEDGFILGVYGNANEDGTIDMGDVVYTKLAIFGKKPKTELCDAKYDGRINVLDVIQTKLIILGKEKELTLFDYLDNIVTVNKPVNRIIVTTSQILELLRTVKLESDRMVGGESVYYSGEVLVNYKIFFPEFIDLAPVGKGSEIDIEAILSLNPDLVLLSASPWRRPVLDPVHDKLESAGIAVFRAKGGSGSGAGRRSIEEVKKFGYIFGKQAEAKEFLDFYEGWSNSINEKVERIPEEDKPKVYFESVMGSKKYYASSDIYAHVDWAGGKTIFPKGGVVDPEAVIERNPDIIIIMGYCGRYNVDADDTAKLEEMREEIMNRPELQGVTAVKEGRVYVISNYIACYSGEYNGCICLLQIAYMAKWFHPELFEDLDPKAIHQEYLTRFQGLDIDLDEKGVFVYPEPS